MNSSAPASRAARITSSSVRPGRPAVMLSRTVPRNRKLSCKTTPKLRRRWIRLISRSSTPSILRKPLYSRLMPCSRRVTVLLPEPLRPTTPSMVPAGMLNDIRSSAGCLLPG